MNGKDRDRSWSEVGDTLRYLNSMASSHSWCCADTDDQSSSALALIGLNQLDMPIEGAAMATAAAKAVAVVAAVSCDNFDDHDEESECIQMKKFSTASLGVSKAEVVELCQRHWLSPPSSTMASTSSSTSKVNEAKGRTSSKKKSVSIVLSAPNEDTIGLDNMEESTTSDPLLNKSDNLFQGSSIVGGLRRASDDYPYANAAAANSRSNMLQVINVIDNPLLYNRQDSDGLLALRADRERLRRHSMCPDSHRTISSSKSITTNVKGWLQNLNHGRESRSLEGMDKKTRFPRFSEVPEVVVSHHLSPEEPTSVEADNEDVQIEKAHRDLMVKTVQKYLTLDPTTPLRDKLFTAGLLALTMVGIMVLFWYQNFGPGFTTNNTH